MTGTTRTTTPIWVPDPEQAAASTIARFARYAATHHGAPVADPLDYHGLWRWSVQHLEQYWAAVWEFSDIRSATPYKQILPEPTMPGSRWFTGAQVNYAEHILRARAGDQDTPALACLRETGERLTITWAQLRGQVAAPVATLRALGVSPGDRVVGYLPPGPHAVVGLLATAAIGAVWSQCAPDYNPPAVLDRFAQLAPTVLIAADGYRHNGTTYDRRADTDTIAAGLSLAAVIDVDHIGLGPATTSSGVPRWSWTDATADTTAPRNFAPVPFDHPLWVLFTSGTTGRPKGIVHGHGGITLGLSALVGMTFDLAPGDRFFWYTSTNWMMWNVVVSALVTGATAVIYDGSPTHPDPSRLWRIAAEHGVTYFGTSPGYLAASERAGLDPAGTVDLSALRTLGSTGSPLPVTAYHWVTEHVGERVQLSSCTGGTDAVTAFAASNPLTPVWPGELSAPCLGVALESWDERGNAGVGRVGELVLTKPLPSMPLYFWGDPDGARLRQAYFDTYPGVWRHGDWVTFTDRGSLVLHGRSDATLNRHGIRLGSAEIYDAVEALPEIGEALIVGVDEHDGGYWMPLFVTLTARLELTDELRERIRRAIRSHASPRHVPDDIIAVPAIPHTKTGKRLEVPIKRILQGADPADVLSYDAIDNPHAVDSITTAASTARNL